VREYSPVRGVFCIRSLVATSVCIVMLLVIFGMKTTPTASINTPVRKKMTSIARKVMRILFSIMVVGQHWLAVEAYRGTRPKVDETAGVELEQQSGVHECKQ